MGPEPPGAARPTHPRAEVDEQRDRSGDRDQRPERRALRVDDDDRPVGPLERLDRRRDALLPSRGGIVKRQVGGGRLMPERLKALPQGIPAGGLVPGAVQ